MFPGLKKSKNILSLIKNHPVEKEDVEGSFSFNVDVEMINSLSTDNNPCESNPSKYPDLMQCAEIAAQMTAQGCITPYM